MRRLKQFLCLAAITCAIYVRQAPAEVVVWNRSSPDLVRRAILVPQAEFANEAMTTIARRVLNENRGRRFIQLQICVEEDQANPFPRMGDLKFEEWLAFQRKLGELNWRIAELTAFDGRAVLRIRNGEATSRLLLEGSTDPLIWKVDGAQLEILHVAFPQLSWATTFQEVHVFATSSEPVPKETLSRWFKTLKERLHARLKVLTVQNTPWFVFDDEFPMYYWFETAEPPTRAEFESTWSVKCVDTTQGVRCY